MHPRDSPRGPRRGDGARIAGTALSQRGGAGDYGCCAAAAPRIGLALSGGGARGIAHVGVLKVLEEMRIPSAA